MTSGHPGSLYLHRVNQGSASWRVEHGPDLWLKCGPATAYSSHLGNWIKAPGPRPQAPSRLGKAATPHLVVPLVWDDELSFGLEQERRVDDGPDGVGRVHDDLELEAGQGDGRVCALPGDVDGVDTQGPAQHQLRAAHRAVARQRRAELGAVVMVEVEHGDGNAHHQEQRQDPQREPGARAAQRRTPARHALPPVPRETGVGWFLQLPRGGVGVGRQETVIGRLGRDAVPGCRGSHVHPVCLRRHPGKQNPSL